MRFRSLLVPGLACLAAASCLSTAEDPADGHGESAANGSTISVPLLVEASAPAARQEGDDAQEEAEPEQAEPSTPLDLQSETQRLELLRQRQGYLAQQYVDQGDAALDRADFPAALHAYSQALEVMPSSEAARAGLRKVRALMGEEYADAASYFEDAVALTTVRNAQARMEIEQHILDGDNHLRAGEHDRAIDSYRRAEMILRFHPQIASESLDEQILRNKLESAVQAAEEAARAEDLAATAEAARQAAEREEEQRTYRENKLKALYNEAYAAFQRDDYARAESLSSQILLWDPGNEYAIEMRDVSAEARHAHVDSENRRLLRENWVKTFEDIEKSAIPQHDSIIFNDLKRWREVSQRPPLEFSRADVAEDRDREAILARLNTVQIKPRFNVDGEGVPLTEVATYLQKVTSVNFLVSPRVLDEIDEEESAVTLNIQTDRSVRKVLDLITETSASDNLAWKIQDGVVMFVTKEEMIGGQVLAMYEVRDLIHPVKDFPGREINVEPSGGIEPPDEDFEEREALVVTQDSLDQLIRENVAPASWDEDPNNSLRITNGTLVVYQTPAVQEQIKALLDDLREATGIMVDVQARFLKVEDNFLEDIGVDFRGLGAPGKGTNQFFDDFGNATLQQDLGNEIGLDTDAGFYLDEGADGDLLGRIENLYDSSLGDTDVLTNAGGLSFQWTYLNDLQLEMVLRAVSKSERVELVTAPRLLVFNTARSNLTVLNQVAYVQDYDVEIAQAASIADPIVNVVEDGVILDVRPVVSADRRYITLELRPTVAELKRPIRTIVTSLGNSGNPVTIQLPELEVSRARTSVPMPDGGTILLGGFKAHEQQDLRSGVPILNKIPILSFFFERKGNYVANSKLLILLKANIVIPKEHEPTPAQLGLESIGPTPRAASAPR
jgi:Flp pilus assembly secretin CpaC/tetratricopeptide (TPR) repeat protein